MPGRRKHDVVSVDNQSGYLFTDDRSDQEQCPQCPLCPICPVCSGCSPNVSTCGDGWAKFVAEDSIIHLGRSRLLRKNVARAAAGEEVVLVATGGSITVGHGAKDESLGWAAQVGAWWTTMFPKSKYARAALSGTGSFFGALCSVDYVLDNKPDILLFEFSVNDYDLMSPLAMNVKGPMFENFLLRLAYQYHDVAIVFVFPDARNNKATAEDWHSAVAHHYGFATVSRKRLEKSLSFFAAIGESAFDDIWHPNNYGHTILADLVIRALERALGQPACDDEPEEYACILSAENELAQSTACYSVLKTINPVNIAIAENHGFEVFDILYHYEVFEDQLIQGWDKKTTLHSTTNDSWLTVTVTGVDTIYLTGYLIWMFPKASAMAEILDTPCQPVVIGQNYKDEYRGKYRAGYPPLIEDQRGYQIVKLNDEMCTIDPAKTYKVKFTTLRHPAQFIALQGTRRGMPEWLQRRRMQHCPATHPVAAWFRSPEERNADALLAKKP